MCFSTSWGVLLLWLTRVAVADIDGLVDQPILGSWLSYLDGSSWTASADEINMQIAVTVPGDLISDLYAAGVIEDPLFELNFQNASLWSEPIWTYETTFTVQDDVLRSLSSILLVFDGIKMGATITVNGQFIGEAIDQFVRYVFSLDVDVLLAGTDANTVQVTFEPSMNVSGRYMACTGGWDWAPWSSTTVENGLLGSPARTFSKGIWKSVYLVAVEAQNVAITYVVPHVFYTGPFPTEPLIDGQHSPFSVQVRTHFWTSTSTTGQLNVSGSWGSSSQLDVITVPAGDSNVTLTLTASAEQISLWWPTGLGEQPLYNVSIEFIPTMNGTESISAIRKIGFRYFALVTGNDTDPNWVQQNADADGTELMGMRFRVNGAPIYSRGANMIPMDELEGRYSAQATRILVQSAVAGNMNTLRVWGGGVFQPDVFYDTCDELGVLVYHDMQFAQQGHSPTVCTTQENEFRHQIRRLSAHPSIVIWDGCNECQVVLDTPTGIYASFVLSTVVEEDTSRVVWPSCPSYGWQHGVNRLSSLPNDSPYGLVPVVGNGNMHVIEFHGPYLQATGYPTVNGPAELQWFSPNLPINVSQVPVGLAEPNLFVSEFGVSVMTSFESLSATLLPEHWSLHGGLPADSCVQSGWGDWNCTGPNPMSQRNHPCDSIIFVYFGMQNLDEVGEFAFKKQLYMCMIGQALSMKSAIEMKRSLNMFGTVIWQLGEIWPSGGWGSLEYASPETGQVIGGRWKPLHYWLASSTFADLLCACGLNGQCYVKNDSPFHFQGTVVISSVELSTGEVTTVYNSVIQLASGPGQIQWFTIPFDFDRPRFVLLGDVFDETQAAISQNLILLDTPGNLTLPSADVVFSVGESVNPDGSVDLKVSTNTVALFVTFTTAAIGRFSANSFLLLPGTMSLQFLPFDTIPVDLAILTNTLRVEHVQSYL